MTDNIHLIHAQGKLIAAQGEEIAALKAQLAIIMPAIEHLLPRRPSPPSQSNDHLMDRMLARSTGEQTQRMADAVGTDLVQAIVKDNRGR